MTAVTWWWFVGVILAFGGLAYAVGGIVPTVITVGVVMAVQGVMADLMERDGR